MKILLIGASGTIGRKVYQALAPRHEIITASPSQGQVQVDITDPYSIRRMFEAVGPFDALVSTTGSGPFGPLADLQEPDFMAGIRSKLLGQVNLVLTGQHYINPGGSFTLTSGILATEPIRGGAALSLMSSGINGFVLAAAIELGQGRRINAVSPGLVQDSAEALGAFFPGHDPVPMHRVASAYLKSVEGGLTGKVLQVHA